MAVQTTRSLAAVEKIEADLTGVVDVNTFKVLDEAGRMMTVPQLTEKAVAAERERCAKIALDCRIVVSGNSQLDVVEMERCKTQIAAAIEAILGEGGRV